MEDKAAPRGTPEDYREFVRQMEAAAARNSAGARAREWRGVDERTRALRGAELMNLSSRIARYTGYRKPPLKYPRLPDVKRAS